MQLESEWLETDGWGGFACGVVSGELRRKWHGLLWLATKPPRARVRLLAGMEEFLRHPQMTVALSATWRDGAWHPPAGWPSFEPHPVPHWWWELEGGACLRKFVYMSHEHQGVLYVTWRLDGSPAQDSAQLSFRPVLPFESNPESFSDEHYILGHNEGVSLHLRSSRPVNFMHHESDLGEVSLETEKDCEKVWTQQFYGGPEFSFTLKAGEPVTFAWGPHDQIDPHLGEEIYHEVSERRISLAVPKLSERHAPLGIRLAAAADQFIVRVAGTELSTILAGYPWFTDWGRDTMISLPGLCIATSRHEEARAIMRHFLAHLDKGVIPNIFPEEGAAPMYNTIDATLWLVEAYFRCIDPATLTADSEDWAKLCEIIQCYHNGTHNDIRVEADGLVAGGTTGSQLTWMDVKVNGEVPTPRHGKAVEIQGLWYNALMLMAEAAERLEDEGFAEYCRGLADQCQESFVERFVSPEHEHLADVVDRDGEGTADWAVRPNMILPFGLAHNVIPEKKRAAVLRVASRDLLTPRGLRSLGPEEPQYRERYQGELLQRDRAYHQGTVWMWLVGPYFKGIHRERELVPDLAELAPSFIDEFVFHFENEGCLNQCSEIFDAEPPHYPRGCFAQAWSVAALIEILELEW